MAHPTRSVRGLVLALAALALATLGALVTACDSEDARVDTVSVSVQVAATDIPITATVSEPEQDDRGLWAHSVTVQWDGAGTIVLEDARFTHHVQGTSEGGDGDLVTAGRGCGAEWSDSENRVVQACTADLQIIRLGTGETHAYPVRIYPEVGPLTLSPGTYVVEEEIPYWTPSTSDGPASGREGDPDGTFVLRLEYVVE